jgi:hypothetical protein
MLEWVGGEFDPDGFDLERTSDVQKISVNMLIFIQYWVFSNFVVSTRHND